MTPCAAPETLSQFADGTLSPAEDAQVSRHVRTCLLCRQRAEELGRVADWFRTVSEPGPYCLSADTMASVLEGAAVPEHVRKCPRCAAELKSLRPEKKGGTRRRAPRSEPVTGWVAAAAVFAAIGLLLFIANRSSQNSEKGGVVKAPEEIKLPPPPPPPPPPEKPIMTPPAPRAPELAPRVEPIPGKPESAPPLTPAPVLKPETPAPQPEPPVTPPPPTRTAPEAPARAVVAMTLRSGSVTTLSEGKWVKPARVEEGMALRAEGRTQLDFAQARITLDGSSRFKLAQQDLSLEEGALTAEIFAGSVFALVLDQERIVPQAAASRVLLSAKADRVIIDEGAAKWKDLVLHEGVEHHVKKEKLEPQKRRTLAATPRPREALTWKLDFNRQDLILKGLGAGRLEKFPEGRMIVSAPSAGSLYSAHIGYYAQDGVLFTVKPTTAIRFRYFLTAPAYLELVAKNATKDENFNKPLPSVVRQWTTVTMFLRDIPANPGGKKVACEVGDKYQTLGWFVGVPPETADLYIDQLEILEIDR